MPRLKTVSCTLLVFYFSETKRKGDEGIDNPQPKMKRVDTTKRCSDLIVLGLPWKSEEEDVREYFEKFGELVLVQVTITARVMGFRIEQDTGKFSFFMSGSVLKMRSRFLL